VNDLVESIVAGKGAGQVNEGEQRFGLAVRLKEEARRDAGTIKNLLLTAPSGARAPLGRLADVAVI
jgi:cobalt-zinc-cadmium resistance protein CzcA